MFRVRFLCVALAVFCLVSMGCVALAAETDCDSVYCFSAEDFIVEEDALAGICVTHLPDAAAGTVLLGNRVIRSGDILTADQLDEMSFSPLRAEDDRQAVVTYLPIYENRVGAAAQMTLSIRGKKDNPPTAEDFAMETYKNLPNKGVLKASDPEGEALTFTLVRQPKRGEVTLNEDGSFTYTPKKNKVGVDSFVYTAADPAGKVSREATVTITILKPSDSRQYQDTLGSDCRFAADWMRHTGIFSGEHLAEKSCFGPDKEVTRGEFVTMLVKTLDIPVEEGLVYTGYTDEVPVWLQPYLAAAVRSGLTAGLEAPETFRSAEVITTAEAAVMVANGLDLAETFAGSAEEPLTRAMAAKILYRTAQELEAQKIDTVV